MQSVPMKSFTDLSGHRLIAFDFDANTREAAPIVAYDVLLVRSGVVVASLGKDEKYCVGRRVDGLPDLADARGATATIVARRLLLCFDALHRTTGYRLVIVLPSKIPSAARVLCHALSDRITPDASVAEAGSSGLRRSDEDMYVLLSQLLATVSRVLHDSAATYRVSDWNELHALLAARMHAVCALLLPAASHCFDGIGNLPMPICGSVPAAPMTALLVCTVMGLACLEREQRDTLVGETDYRMFLPQLFVAPSQSDAALPAPWMEAECLAARFGMFFGVTAAPDGIRLRVCPLRPDRAELYALRAATAAQMWRESAPE